MSPRTTTTRSRTALNRSDLVQRALDLADQNGLDALTVRRLADEFSVTPMAMYWHFAAKDDLLAAMGDRVIEDIEIPDESLGLSAFLTAAITRIVEALRAHPSAARLVPARIMQSAAGRELTERALAVLEEAGFDVDAAAQVAHNALQTAVMLVAGEPGREMGVRPEDREEVLRGKRAALLALPPETYPHLHAAADALTHCGDPDTYYDSSIETFVLGVAAQGKR